MNKKQVILSISSMLSIATLILAWTPEERRLRLKQIIEDKAIDKRFRRRIYTGELKVTDKNKDKAIRIINIHRERLINKLENRENFLEKYFPPFLCFALGVASLIEAEKAIREYSNGTSSISLIGSYLFTGSASFLLSWLNVHLRRDKIKRLENSLNCDIQVLEKLNSMQKQNVT